MNYAIHGIALTAVLLQVLPPSAIPATTQSSAFHVAGRVVNAEGKTSSSLPSVWLRSGCMAGPKTRIAEPSADGSFDFDAVQPGEYCLSVGFTKEMHIRVADKSLPDIQLEITPNIDGRVVVEGNGALPSTMTVKFGRGECVDSRGPCTLTVTSRVAADGKFKVYNPITAPCFFLGGEAEGYAVTSMKYGNLQWLDDRRSNCPQPRAGNELVINISRR